MTDRDLSEADIIRLERRLAKFANLMDSLVRIPFTRQGVGADSLLSTIPFVGDIAGLILTAYAFVLGRKMGVPRAKLLPAVKLAVADLVVGLVPVAGTLVDIFIRPSRRTLDIVHDHIREHHDLPDEFHIQKPFLHEALERKQAGSAFWRNPVVAWFWLHIPDILGLLTLVLVAGLLWMGLSWLTSVLQPPPA